MSLNALGRNTRVYNQEERAVIDQYKTAYMEAGSPTARKNIAQYQIFPSIFNYWVSIGEVIDKAEERFRSQKLLSWIRNVWRTSKKGPRSERKHYKLTDLLWKTREADVLQEIASMRKMDKVTTSTEGWFNYRTKASKNLIDKMTDGEKAQLQQEADRWANEGLPEDIQRKTAEEKWHSRFSKTAINSYKEMGLVSLSFVAYTQKNGQLTINIHDDISELLGVPAKPFYETYIDKTEDIQRAMLEYVKKLRATKSARTGIHTNAGTHTNASTHVNAGSENNAGSCPISLQIDLNGFPIAPSSESLNNINKKNLENLYRSYISLHYGFASGRTKTRQVPFTQMQLTQFDFIERKYLPDGLELKDARAMKREEIINFFEHIRARQESGIRNEDAFRFKAVLSRRKKGNIQESRYMEGIVQYTAPALGTHSEPLVPSPVSGPLPALTTPNQYTAPALGTNLEPRQPPVLLPVSMPVPALATSIPSIVPRPRLTKKGKEKSRVDDTQQSIPSQYSFNTFETNNQTLPQNPDVSRPFLTLDPSYNVDRRIDLDPSLDPTFDGLSFQDIPNLNIPPLYPHPQYLNTPALTPEPDSRSPSQYTPEQELTNQYIPALTSAFTPASTQIRDLPPDNDPTPSQPVSRLRRKGVNAQKLAMKEAKVILKKRKTRR